LFARLTGLGVRSAEPAHIIQKFYKNINHNPDMVLSPVWAPFYVKKTAVLMCCRQPGGFLFFS